MSSTACLLLKDPVPRIESACSDESRRNDWLPTPQVTRRLSAEVKRGSLTMTSAVEKKKGCDLFSLRRAVSVVHVRFVLCAKSRKILELTVVIKISCVCGLFEPKILCF